LENNKVCEVYGGYGAGNCELFITAHTTSDNFTTVSPSDGDVETVWLDITVSESDGEEDKVFVLATLAQETVIQQQNQTINNLTNKINKLGSRIEEQEQYSRRTSLRFNNVKAPTNDRGEIRRPIDTDALVLKICNTKLGLQLLC
jgi:hypothetical protein